MEENNEIKTIGQSQYFQEYLEQLGYVKVIRCEDCIHCEKYTHRSPENASMYTCALLSAFVDLDCYCCWGEFETDEGSDN